MNATGVLSSPERRQALADRYEAPQPPPLDSALLHLLDLPPDLPDVLTVTEAAAVTGLTAHTLRYYERVGLVVVDRDKAGHRQYDRAALARIMFVTRLRLSDMPITTISHYIDLIADGDRTAPARLAVMQGTQQLLRRSRVRRSSVGLRALKTVTAEHPGPWQVAFQDANEKAVAFWRRAATELAGAAWTEERRAVPHDPSGPPDVWISFEA